MLQLVGLEVRAQQAPRLLLVCIHTCPQVMLGRNRTARYT